MKILLDESVPRKLKYDFGQNHEVKTVSDQGWLGQKNGNLLKLIIEHNFELFIPVDRNLQYQQNFKNLPLIISVFCAFDNWRETLALLIPKLFDRLAQENLQGVNLLIIPATCFLSK